MGERDRNHAEQGHEHEREQRMGHRDEDERERQREQRVEQHEPPGVVPEVVHRGGERVAHARLRRLHRTAAAEHSSLHPRRDDTGDEESLEDDVDDRDRERREDARAISCGQSVWYWNLNWAMPSGSV